MAYITVAELRAYLDVVDSDTFTASAAADTLTLSSVRVRDSLKTAQEVEVSTTGTLPAPLAASTVYYVILGTDQAIQLATTSANADAGTNIDLTTAGTGTHTVTKSINDTTLLTGFISRAEKYINEQTNRVFEAQTLTKYYDASAIDDRNSRKLHVDDDLLTITELLNADSSNTEITSADYFLLPRNSTPYHQILLKSNGSSTWEFDTDEYVSVTGTWGYSATPDENIKQATTILAAYYYHQKDSHIFDTTAIPEAGVITIPAGIPATVTKILHSGYQEYL
jgi:hypothetical protein